VNPYLDASVLVSTLVQEAGTPPVEAFLIATDSELLISDFAAAEVSSGLSRLLRMGRLTSGDATARLADFDAWRAAVSSPVDLRPGDGRLADAYVRRFDLGLRAPDALHLAIVRRLDATLVTLDRRMARAAEALGIAVVVPHAP
jgi:hypothetical protein